MTLSVETVNEMIRFALLNTTITSANPTHINTVIDVANFQSPGITNDDVTAGSGDISTGGLGGIKPGDIQTALTAARGGNLLALGSRGLALLGPVGIAAMGALMLPTITKGIIDELQRPGGLLDKRVRINASEEAFAVLDRQTRQNTRIGDRQVIIQQFEGFRNFNGYASTNTSELIRTNADRVLDIGLFDRAQGLSQGGR